MSSGTSKASLEAGDASGGPTTGSSLATTTSTTSVASLTTPIVDGTVSLTSATTPKFQSVTMLSLNTYLIPKWFVKAGSSCTKQEERAKAIANYILEKPDIVALQEMWGAGVDVMEDTIASKFDILDYNRKTQFFGFGGTLFDAGWQYWNSNGGLYFAVRKSVPLHVPPPGNPSATTAHLKIIHHERETYEVSGTLSKKGVCGALIDMSPVWGFKDNEPLLLLVINTHLDPQHYPEQQQVQVTQLYDFVLRLLQKIPSILKHTPNDEIVEEVEEEENEEEADEGEGEEGATKRVRTASEIALFRKHFSVFQRLGVLMCGDFNCTSDSLLYQNLMKNFTSFEGEIEDLHNRTHRTTRRLRDLYRDKRGLESYPPTDSDAEEATYSSENSYAEFCYNRNGEKIDHIFALDAIESKIAGKFDLMRIEVDRIEVVRQPRGKEFSDHYGLLLTFHPSFPQAKTQSSTSTRSTTSVTKL